MQIASPLPHSSTWKDNRPAPGAGIFNRSCSFTNNTLSFATVYILVCNPNRGRSRSSLVWTLHLKRCRGRGSACRASKKRRRGADDGTHRREAPLRAKSIFKRLCSLVEFRSRGAAVDVGPDPHGVGARAAVVA